MLQCAEVVGSEVRQVSVLGVAPDAFHGVEVRGVGWQPLDDDPLPGGQPGLDTLCPVGAVSVPDERESAGKVPPECFKEPEDLCGSDVVGIHGPVEAESASPGSHGEGADRGEPVATVPLTEDGRLAAGRPGAADHRLEHETALVKKNDSSTGSSGVFLYGATAWTAIVLWPPRLAPGLDAPASDNSTPPREGSSRRGRGGSEPRRFWR